ncbi:MAG TPA: GAF domain-containing sensor histidine kinase [Anaerolineae bacterium]|nr:GAF domain-containing sensor histidine kinase [Anaerolineae bacterium]
MSEDELTHQLEQLFSDPAPADTPQAAEAAALQAQVAELEAAMAAVQAQAGQEHERQEAVTIEETAAPDQGLPIARREPPADTADHGAEGQGQRLNLLRYFSVVSSIAFIVAIVLLGVFYRQTAVSDLIKLEESKNAALTQAFANSLWPQFAPFVTSATGLSSDELRTHPETAKLRQAILAQVKGLAVVKVKVYDLEGLTVFSTEESQIGQDGSTNAGFLSARSGGVASLLTHRDTFNAFEGEIEDRDVFSSYSPVRRGGSTGPIEGVFEIYSDVTPLLQEIEQTQRNVVIGVTVILASLYAVLIFVVRYAQTVIQRHRVERGWVEEKLRTLNTELEARMSARTRDLALATEVSQRLSAMRGLDILLAEAVKLIQERFDLYYTQIYLADPAERTLRLRAGTGSVGEELIRRGHRLPIGPGSINGTAAYEKRALIVADTAQSAIFLPNPLLPDTRSEMAVPLIAGERVVGVLDLQSAEPGALTAHNLMAFQALAGQLAIAIENASLFAEAAQTRAEVEAQAQHLTRVGWQDFLNATDRRERLGYTYDLTNVTPLNEALPQEVPPSGQALAVPIVVAGEEVGGLRLESDSGRTWTVDDAELVMSVAGRVARQVENLRLLAQAEHYRAEAEAATRRLTREGWEGFLASRAAPETGYVYDLNQVAPLSVEPAGSSSPFIHPLQVRGGTIGELAIDGPEGLGDEAVDLVAKVAERLSAQVETLRLTEQVQAALAEQAATVTRLRELDHLKSSFLANMSHELRTPLNSILGFTDVLLEGLDGPLTDTMQNDLRLIGRNGQHLLSLINDVLDMAKIEAGKMNLSVERFNLGEVLEEVLDITGPLAREKSLDLRLENGSADGLELHADRIRLRQAMINLVGNAIKFTETGGIFVRAERDNGCIRISVRDTGVGVRPEQAHLIFEEFGQVDTSTTRTTGGTGLGLPISKRLVEMHGGRLWVESSGVPGEGATFIIELPAADAGTPPEGQAQ